MQSDRREILHVIERQVELFKARQSADTVEVTNPARAEPYDPEVSE